VGRTEKVCASKEAYKPDSVTPALCHVLTLELFMSLFWFGQGVIWVVIGWAPDVQCSPTARFDLCLHSSGQAKVSIQPGEVVPMLSSSAPPQPGPRTRHPVGLPCRSPQAVSASPPSRVALRSRASSVALRSGAQSGVGGESPHSRLRHLSGPSQKWSGVYVPHQSHHRGEMPTQTLPFRFRFCGRMGGGVVLSRPDLRAFYVSIMVWSGCDLGGHSMFLFLYFCISLCWLGMFLNQGQLSIVVSNWEPY
jgi:hypothetical protein